MGPAASCKRCPMSPGLPEILLGDGGDVRKRLESGVWGLCLGEGGGHAPGHVDSVGCGTARAKGEAGYEVKSQGGGREDALAICPGLGSGVGPDCPVASYPSVSGGGGRGCPCPSLCSQGRLGVRACVPRRGPVSSAVTPPSQLLVWATSSQADSQAPMCALELIREEGTAKIPRPSWEAEGSEGQASSSPSLCQCSKSTEAQGGSRDREGQPLPKGTRIKEKPPQTAGWLLQASNLSRFCATPGFNQRRGPQGKEEIINESSEAPICQRTHVVGGRRWRGRSGHTNNSSIGASAGLRRCLWASLTDNWYGMPSEKGDQDIMEEAVAMALLVFFAQRGATSSGALSNPADGLPSCIP